MWTKHLSCLLHWDILHGKLMPLIELLCWSSLPCKQSPMPGEGVLQGCEMLLFAVTKWSLNKALDPFLKTHGVLLTILALIAHGSSPMVASAPTYTHNRFYRIVCAGNSASALPCKGSIIFIFTTWWHCPQFYVTLPSDHNMRVLRKDAVGQWSPIFRTSQTAKLTILNPADH